jgi:hypothetical protein
MKGMERRWYQFSLRSIFCFATVLAIICAVVSPIVQQYEHERVKREKLNQQLRREFEEDIKRFPKFDSPARSEIVNCD